MTPRLTPAELRTAVRLFAIYTEATAQILAEEQAAEEVAPPSGSDQAAARTGDLITTPEGRARFAAYLDRLEVTHPDDREMAAYVRLHRRLIAEAASSHTTPHAARLDRSPQVAAATEGDPS